METFPILVDLGLVVTAAGVLLLLSRPLRVPPILAYLAAGLLLGPVTGTLAVTESVEIFSELGVALLLFLVGLELSLARLRDVGGTAAVAGLLQVGLTTALGAGLAAALGFSATDALLLGIATAFSSTVVVVKLLARTGSVVSLHGRLAVGILLIQDVVVALALTLVAGLGSGGEGGAGALVGGLGQAGLGILTLGLLALVGVRWCLPRLLRWMAAEGEAFFIVALTWCFGFILVAEAFHVSLELGAFIAGVGLAQLPYSEELVRRVHPLADFFLAVFFVSLGIGMELSAIPDVWLPALLISVFVLMLKPLIVWALTRRKVGSEDAFRAGLTLGQISEFSFILVGLAVAGGLVESPLLQPLVGLVGLTTIGLSALAVPLAPRLFDILRPLLDRAPDMAGAAAKEAPLRRGHIVVVGMNTLGLRLVERFGELGEVVVAVDTDPEKLASLPEDIGCVFGNVDNPSVLEEAGVTRARLVVSALQIEDANALLAHRCRRLDVPVSVHAFDPSLVDELLEIGADHLMVSKLDGIQVLEAELRRLGVMG